MFFIQKSGLGPVKAFDILATSALPQSTSSCFSDLVRNSELEILLSRIPARSDTTFRWFQSVANDEQGDGKSAVQV